MCACVINRHQLYHVHPQMFIDHVREACSLLWPLIQEIPITKETFEARASRCVLLCLHQYKHGRYIKPESKYFYHGTKHRVTSFVVLAA